MGGLRPVHSHWNHFRSSSSNQNLSNDNSGDSSSAEHHVDDNPHISSPAPVAVAGHRLSRKPSLLKFRALMTPQTAQQSANIVDHLAVDNNGYERRSGKIKKAKSCSQLHIPRAKSSQSPKSADDNSSAQMTSTWEITALERALPKHLAVLPPEVWDLIEFYLSAVDKAFLALSCHFLEKRLNPKAFDEINTCPYKLDKLDFLKNFHPRLPDHVLCPKCATFHHHGKKHFQLNSKQLFNHVSQQFMQRDCVRRAAKAYLFETYELEWWQVQMIIRAQLISPRYGIQPRALCLESSKPHGPWNTCSEATVADGRLLVKVHSARAFDFRSRRCQDPKVDEDFPTCSHLNEKTMLTKACQQVTSSVKEPYPGNPSFRRESTLYRCEWCPSEYQADLRSVDLDDSRAAAKAKKKNCRFLLCVTRWIDTGDGLRSDSDEWFALTTIRKHCGKGAAYRGSPYDIGELPAIKCRYEGSSNMAGDAPVESICASVKPK